MENKHIGSNIERLRHIKGLKQQVLANQLGISQAAFSKIEKSEKISPTTLNRISESLNIDQIIIENFDEKMIFRSLESHLATSNDADLCRMTTQEMYEQIINLERQKNIYLMNIINSKNIAI
ncbi:MAG: helix-turn-helix domain-containing protein [Flavipsychrobacter sp.]|nr:helix-turn-helix domain-containing protein [Flavipsychrobacter sp.]